MDAMDRDVCRTCVRKCTNGQSIWTENKEERISLAVLLNRCAGIPVSPHDGLPQKICERCAQKLEKIFAFVAQCKQAHRVLFQKLPRTDSLKTEIEIDIKSEPDYDTKEDIDFSDDSDEPLKPPKTDSQNSNSASKIERSKSKSLQNKQRRHIVSKRHLAQRLTCVSCNYVAKTIRLLKSHMVQSHSDASGRIQYDCSVCARRFKRKSELIVHLRIHSGEKPFACCYCPMRFAQSGTLIEHKRMHTGEMPYSCKLCSKSFGSRSALWTHRIVHTKERPYSCELCGKSFQRRSALKHHTNVHSDERPHTCDICGKAVKTKFALQQHMFIHSEKSYVCDQCGKKFSSKANLDQHIKNMHSEYAGKCQVCNKNTSNLDEHMLIHSNKALYKCDICDRPFRMKNAYSFHMTLHKNADKYKCTIEGCTKAFPKQNMLNFHILKIHSNETPHKCQYCSKGYLRASDLKRHQNSFHSDVNSVSVSDYLTPNK